MFPGPGCGPHVVPTPMGFVLNDSYAWSHLIPYSCLNEVCTGHRGSMLVPCWIICEWRHVWTRGTVSPKAACEARFHTRIIIMGHFIWLVNNNFHKTERRECSQWPSEQSIAAIGGAVFVVEMLSRCCDYQLNLKLFVDRIWVQNSVPEFYLTGWRPG